MTKDPESSIGKASRPQLSREWVLMRCSVARSIPAGDELEAVHDLYDTDAHIQPGDLVVRINVDINVYLRPHSLSG